MKQSVNLYLPEFRKKKDWLTAVHMVQVCGLAMLLMLLVAGWEYWNVQKLNQELQEVEQQRVAAVEATNSLRTSFGSQSPDQDIVEQNRRLEETVNEKQAILEFLRGRDLGNTGGFSEYLADLARYHTEGMSLDAISLTSNGESVSLRGSVLRAELVPIYLQNLSQGESFRGMSFHTLDIAEAVLAAGPGSEAQELNAWNFSVSTNVQQAGGQ